jgi:regulation of enolase protein 1 (concanavalin A-like superfamily)
MIRSGCLFLVFVSTAAAAPPPAGETPAVKLFRLFGETVDPDKDCTFTLDGEKLKLTIPEASHSLTTTSGVKPNAPKTKKAVEGDFTAEVTVVRSDPGPNGSDMAAAGLAVWNGEGHVVTAQRFHTRSGQEERVVVYRSDVIRPNAALPKQGLDARLSPHLTVEEAGKAVRLRLTRSGKTWTFETSLDSTTWQKVHTREEEFPQSVEVGVFAERTRGEKPFEAVFENLTITPAKKK